MTGPLETGINGLVSSKSDNMMTKERKQCKNNFASHVGLFLEVWEKQMFVVNQSFEGKKI